ncbi:hypothetical protein [Vaginisenegalia massiliensis]|uniref:hypothetical protein n=1 Tax=Vaginisenegalia massiliensis TaxID=2058294 RepID=UPI000F532178|nr:hypothetical protein [Vaginisenegalia massiliensis]
MLISRIYTILVLLMAIVGLIFYSIMAASEGIMKRTLALGLAFILIAFFIRILLKYRKGQRK